MSIENTLERIAVALEAIASGGQLPKPEGKAKASKTTSKASSKTTAAATTKATTPTKEKATTEDGPKIADVRKALGAVQRAFDSDVARALLKEAGGAPTMSKLSEDMYQTVIDAATEKAASAE